jgi:acyl carrier protein
MDIRTTVVNALSELLYEEMGEHVNLDDKLVLLESGLDSLGLAVLIVRLEGTLGFDPFTISDTPYYPRTLGELIIFYENTSKQSGDLNS